MAVVRKKQDDKILKTLREYVSVGGNKQCFDCGQRGPTYVNMTIGSFVCTRCSGVLRGLTPPHRVKSISMATFTNDELEFIKSHGNDDCGKTWLGLWDPKRTNTQEHRELMIDKYERKRYYLEPASPLKSLTNQLPSQQHHHHQSNAISAADQVTTTMAMPHMRGQSIQQPIQNGHIQLTPPISLRLTSRNQKANGGMATTTVPNSTNNFQQLFTPDDNVTNNNINNNNNNNALHMNNNYNKAQLTNGITRNGFSSIATSTTIAKNRQNGATSSALDNNKFTPDTEFVADFGAVNMFNGGIATAGSTSQSSGPVMNGNHKSIMNGNGEVQNADNANADFADFDHNPIYNAAATNSQSSTPVSTTSAPASSNQWNIWQQFQWPFNVQPEQNRWSLPMSLSSTSTSLNSTGTFNSSSSISSASLVDRYAALKDLDEQFREVKDKDLFNASQTPSNGSPSSSSSSSTSLHHQSPPGVNPFKATAATTVGNPFQAVQHQQHILQNHHHLQQQPQQQPNHQHLNGWTTTEFGNGINGGGGGALFNSSTAVNGSNTQMYSNVMMGVVGNGGGMAHGGVLHLNGGFTQQQQQKNPFAVASTLSSNNPFL